MFAMRTVVTAMVWMGAAGCVSVPMLGDDGEDAGEGLAALSHRVDAAVAAWQPLLPGCGAAGAGGGPSQWPGLDPQDGLDGGVDFGPQGPGEMPTEPVVPGLPAPRSQGAILITEIMANPEALADTAGEWFELFNPGAEALDLEGCAIDDGSATSRAVARAFVIEPGQYRVVSRSAAPGFAADLVMSFSLSNDADVLGLSCQGTLIDRVQFATQQGFAIKAGASLSLDPGQLDATQNDMGAAWCAASEAYSTDFGTPGRANPPCAVAS